MGHRGANKAQRKPFDQQPANKHIDRGSNEKSISCGVEESLSLDETLSTLKSPDARYTNNHNSHVKTSQLDRLCLIREKKQEYICSKPPDDGNGDG